MASFFTVYIFHDFSVSVDDIVPIYLFNGSYNIIYILFAKSFPYLDQVR